MAWKHRQARVASPSSGSQDANFSPSLRPANMGESIATAWRLAPASLSILFDYSQAHRQVTASVKHDGRIVASALLVAIHDEWQQLQRVWTSTSRGQVSALSEAPNPVELPGARGREAGLG